MSHYGAFCCEIVLTNIAFVCFLLFMNQFDMSFDMSSIKTFFYLKTDFQELHQIFVLHYGLIFCDISNLGLKQI